MSKTMRKELGYLFHVPIYVENFVKPDRVADVLGVFQMRSKCDARR
jgi:hypothetical protein